jgi:predicted ABC-type ATPase
MGREKLHSRSAECGLKDGEKFDFSTLADNYEQTQEYWDWCWSEKSKPGRFQIPQVILDDDPILLPTNLKQTVNCSAHRRFFDSQLFLFTETGLIPAQDNLLRDSFRATLKEIRANASVKLAGQPRIVFTGGGYGSGKTSIVTQLARWKQLPISPENTVNADIFKQLIPEYNLVKAVGDARASATVHRESVILADELLRSQIEQKRSFIFDSSMAYKPETMERIEFAKKNGYFLTMIGVLTPWQNAFQFAMNRARISRRFPGSDKFLESHHLFNQVFRDYFDLFDEIKIFANLGKLSDIMLVAEKKSGEKLVTTTPDVLNSPPFMPDKASKDL